MMTLQSYKKKKVYLYINLWKQLTYPVAHETAINKYNIWFRRSHFFL